MKSNKLIILITVIVVVAIGIFIFFKEGSLPVNKNNTKTTMFIIDQGEPLNTIARNLSTQGLIRSRIVFYVLVKKLGLERKIQAGDFRLSPSMDAKQIAEELTHGTVDNWLQIIEGLRKEEIAEIVAKNFPITEAEFNKLAPEGYLFPDKYLIPRTASTETIISILTNTFDQRYTNEMQKKASTLGLTKNQVVTLASIVEREARTDESRKNVASILLKRIENEMPLQVDASVQYALGYDTQEKTWWKKNLTEDDLKVDSLYNTYIHKGLPPGPICNPSLSSLNAVVNADPSTPYLFYLTGSDNKMHYAKTDEEHVSNIKKYLK